MEFRLLAFLILGILLFSCKKEDNKFECSYERLELVKIQKTANEKDETQIGIEAAIKGNLKILVPTNGNINGKFNYEKINELVEKTSTEVFYSHENMDRHNTIIALLCGIEREMDTINPSDTFLYNKLLDEKMKLREKYVDFLIASLSNLPPNQKEVEKDLTGLKTPNSFADSTKQTELLSIQLSSATGGFDKVFINGSHVHISSMSTPYNPRIYVNSERLKNGIELKIYTVNGDTCLTSINDKDISLIRRIVPKCR